MQIKKFNLPLTENDIINLKAGDIIEITGTIYTARDAAHKRLISLINENKELPIDLNDATIYYTGPTPKKEHEVIGVAGPTSSYRMDEYTLPLLKKGLKIMIGKGPRNDYIKEYLKEYKALYLSAIGGAAVIISKCIKRCDIVCYEDLGTEAIYKLEVENMHLIVTYDIYGNDLFLDGIKKFQEDI